MINYKEFSIESRKEEFRIGKISPVDLLALGTQIDFDNLEQTKTLFAFALEHIETKVGEKWVSVKRPNADVYYPQGIEDHFEALNELIAYFMKEVVAKTFTKSNG